MSVTALERLLSVLSRPARKRARQADARAEAEDEQRAQREQAQAREVALKQQSEARYLGQYLPRTVPTYHSFCCENIP